MNYVVVDKEQLEADLTTVADSIRAKSGTTEDLAFPLGMKEVVESIDTSKPEQEKTIEITENGTTEVTPDEGKVLSKVTVTTNVENGGGSSGGNNELVWVEDDSPVIYEKRCYQTVGISAYLTEQGTLTYKINGTNLTYINRDDAQWWSYKNYNQIGISHKDYTYEWIKIKQAEIIPTYEPRPEFVIRKIGSSAFACMHNLRIVKIPDTITFMNNCVFYDCVSLQKVELPSGITSLGSSCFERCSTLPQLVLPDTITSIGNACFSGCMSLTSINIPTGVSTIGSHTFVDCRNLRHIDGFERITSISSNTFDGCISLEGTLVFNESIVFSGQNIFRNGYSLTTIIFRGTPSAIDGTMFTNCYNIKDIYVPWSEGEVANAPWGATNATIHYNTTYDADGNPIV